MVVHNAYESAIRRNVYIIMVAGILLCIGLLCSGCSPCPTSPTGTPVAVDGMQAWASAHAHEACILGTRYADGVYIDFGVLIPLTSLPAYTDAGYRLMPISYCNPAE